MAIGLMAITAAHRIMSLHRRCCLQSHRKKNAVTIAPPSAHQNCPDTTRSASHETKTAISATLSHRATRGESPAGDSPSDCGVSSLTSVLLPGSIGLGHRCSFRLIWGWECQGAGVVAVAGRPWRDRRVWSGVSGRRGVRGSATLGQPHMRARGGGVRTLVRRSVRCLQSSVAVRRDGRVAHRRKRGRSCVRDARTAAPPRRARL
jgi:hypothetical protein